MIRDIELKNYVPPFIVDFAEMEQIYNAENKELNAIEKTHWQLIDNRYFNTADINGIERFEKLLDITPLSDDTIESRRFRIKAKWNNMIPYNYVYLYNQLVNLCGDGNFLIETDFNNYAMSITLELTALNMFNDVKKLIADIIPCNITFTVVQKYNTYGNLKALTHGELKPYTQYELRNTKIGGVSN